MTRATDIDIGEFLQHVRKAGGEVGRHYVIAWRTVRHWQGQIAMFTRARAEIELAFARRHYVAATQRASELLEQLEKSGVV
jgi:hypothetical protein